jgi:hypothetical protein
VKQRLGNAGAVRPLAADAEKFAALYESRRSAYDLAEVRIAIASDDPEMTVTSILAHPVFQ